MNQDNFEVLDSFLKIPLESADGVFEKFLEIPGAIFRGEGLQRFLYIRGQRENKVLLVAHGDTVWDRSRGYESFSDRDIVFENGKFFSMNAECGLGADDRAGCAILWILRELGHSLLITDGEESGREGSKWLMNANEDIAEEINGEHQFLVQFDRKNGKDYKCYNVGTKEFRSYLDGVTGYIEPDFKSTTDIVTLCKRIAGVNLSIGYYKEHSAAESLIYGQWENTLNLAIRWLSENNLPLFLLDGAES